MSFEYTECFFCVPLKTGVTFLAGFNVLGGVIMLVPAILSPFEMFGAISFLPTSFMFFYGVMSKDVIL